MRAVHRRLVTTGVLVLAVLGLTPVGIGLTASPAEAATVAPGDGTSSPTAGASCWGIKQQYPASADGAYWLLTAAMDRPAQFHCDMTTDGGGWVLIGRGREGWTFNPKGQGSPATLRTTPDGVGAFAPAALDTQTIEALRNGSNLSTEVDGIRLERAMTSDGSVRQDYRLYPKARTWTWNVEAGQLLNSASIDGTSYSGSNTKDTASGTTGQTVNGLSNRTDRRRLITTTLAAHNSQTGWGTGSGVNSASNASDNFLWNYAGEANPIPSPGCGCAPRRQRRRLHAHPLRGLPAQTEPVALKDRSGARPLGRRRPQQHRRGPAASFHTNVLAIEVVGDRVYVGGRFTGVQNGPGAAQIAQPWLAAFDLNGNWISSFTPQVDGRVWDIKATPDGKLIIAGDFRSVEGQPQTSGLAAIDPITGDLHPTWRSSLTRSTGERAQVRSIDVRGDWIYAAGRFNRVQGGSWNEIGVPNTINVRISNGTPGDWRPITSGTVIDIKVSHDGSRVFLGGHFNNVNGNATHGFHAITDINNGQPIAGVAASSSPRSGPAPTTGTSRPWATPRTVGSSSAAPSTRCTSTTPSGPPSSRPHHQAGRRLPGPPGGWRLRLRHLPLLQLELLGHEQLEQPHQLPAGRPDPPGRPLGHRELRARHHLVAQRHQGASTTTVRGTSPPTRDPASGSAAT